MRPDEAEVIKPASADGLSALQARDIDNEPVSGPSAHKDLTRVGPPSDEHDRYENNDASQGLLEANSAHQYSIAQLAG